MDRIDAEDIEMYADRDNQPYLLYLMRMGSGENEWYNPNPWVYDHYGVDFWGNKGRHNMAYGYLLYGRNGVPYEPYEHDESFIGLPVLYEKMVWGSHANAATHGRYWENVVTQKWGAK